MAPNVFVLLSTVPTKDAPRRGPKSKKKYQRLSVTPSENQIPKSPAHHKNGKKENTLNLKREKKESIGSSIDRHRVDGG